MERAGFSCLRLAQAELKSSSKSDFGSVTVVADSFPVSVLGGGGGVGSGGTSEDSVPISLG